MGLISNLYAIRSDKEANLLPENLKSGITCLGVEGTEELLSITSDADATPADILEGKTAYVDSTKITGTLSPSSGGGSSSKFVAPSVITFTAATDTSIGTENIDVSNVTKFSQTFKGCSKVTELDLSEWNTSNATTMDYMFNGCTSITSLDLSKFNTENVTTMNNMISSCSKLTSLDISNFNTSNVTNMASMFYGCRLLTSIDVSHFNTDKVTTMASMFSGCNAATTINISG